ncbi:MAG: FAD-dependent oxidoreductase [bacterium]
MTAGGSAGKYDVIVIGGGHNGLAAAGLLARRGRKVVVLERRNAVGGLAAAEEFHPGYRSRGVLHDTTGVRHHLIEALALAKHGLVLDREPPSFYACPLEGDGLLLHHDPAKAAGEIAKFSKRDSERYAEYRAFPGRLAR